MEIYSIDFFEEYRINLSSLYGKLDLGVCSVKQRERLISSIKSGDIKFIKGELKKLMQWGTERKTGKSDSFPAEVIRIAVRYIEELEETVKKYGEQLMMPKCSWLDLSDGKECKLSPVTQGEKLAADYSGMSLASIRNTNYLVYRMLLADAVKYSLSKSDKGTEYLNGAYEEMFAPFDRKSFLMGG